MFFFFLSLSYFILRRVSWYLNALSWVVVDEIFRSFRSFSTLAHHVDNGLLLPPDVGMFSATFTELLSFLLLIRSSYTFLLLFSLRVPLLGKGLSPLELHNWRFGAMWGRQSLINAPKSSRHLCFGLLCRRWPFFGTHQIEIEYLRIHISIGYINIHIIIIRYTIQALASPTINILCIMLWLQPSKRLP